MHLEISLVDGDSAGGVDDRGPVDVVLEAPAGAPFSAAREQLAALVHPGDLASTHWSLGGQEVAATAPLGAPPLLRGAVLVASRAPFARGGGPRSPEGAPLRPRPVTVEVAWGPAAGTSAALPLGEHVLGRGPAAAVVLDDVEVSRAHAALEVTSHGARVRDLGSANGTRVRSADGGQEQAVGPGGRALGPGDELLVGASGLRLRVGASRPAAVTATGDGHLAVNRSPREAPERRRLVLELPAPPQAPEPARISVLAIAAPVVLAVVMALVWSPIALLFGLAAPVITLGTAWGERRAQRARHRLAVAAHDERCASVHAASVAASARDRAALEALGPDLGEVVSSAAATGERLWERGGGAHRLLLRLGRGAVPCAVELRCDAGEPSGAPARHEDAPVLLPLQQVGVLGVAGQQQAARGLARSLLVQAAVLHSPRDLAIVVLAAQEPPWEWARWLPHHAAPAWLLEEVPRRLAAAGAAGGSSPARPAVLVLVAGAGEVRRDAGGATVLARGPAVGVHAVCLDEDAAELPLECGAVAVLSGVRGTTLRLRTTAGTERETPGLPRDGSSTWEAACLPGSEVAADLVPAAVAARVARALAPLRDASPLGPSAALPPQVHLLDLLEVDASDGEAVREAWRRRPRTTEVVLGRCAAGPWRVDLARDGPHLLVAGTTGAGKSELLASLVASLAVGNRPEELALVLIDYKGGAAFADLAGLPHVVGLVTDLDPHLTRRALASLQAEVHRRERVLRETGCRDHREHVERRSGPGGAAMLPLPRLVVVVDEFRVLSEELPDFLGGLVRLAAVGRSLGIHLVLATQRPAGAVSADIRANTNLRIALRVQDDTDSLDVVDARDAARIDAATPGRAVVRCGGGPLLAVQTAQVSATRSRGGGAGVRAERRDPRTPRSPGRPDALRARAGGGGGAARDGARPDPREGSDVAALVSAVRDAAHGERLPERPWLPPLPDVVLLSRGPEPVPAGAAAPAAVDDLEIGLVDRPRRQRQEPLRWRTSAGPLLVVGAPRTGRTTAVRAVLAAAAGHSPAALHVHVVAPPSPALAGVEELPQVGAVVDPGDTERLVRLLRLLVDLVRRRQHEPGSAGSRPTTLLLVDGADRVLAEAAALPVARADDPAELLHQLLVDGPAVGVVLLLAGDRSLLLGRCGPVVRQRLLLALGDAGDAALAGVSAREVPARMPPGRVLVLGTAGEEDDGVGEAQVGVLGPGQDADALRTAMAGLSAASSRRFAGSPARPPAVPPLPGRLTVRELRCGWAAADAGHPGELPIGVGGEHVGPVAVDIGDVPHWVVAGAPGSGRSAALVTLAAAAARRGHLVVAIADARSPLTAWAQAPTLPTAVAGSVLRASPGDPRAVAEALEAARGPGGGVPGRAPVVLVDDVERLAGSAAEDLLVEHALGAGTGDARDGGAGVVVAAGTSADLLATYRGLVPVLRRARSGLLLHPLGPGDGELLGAAVARSRPGPVGRAALVHRGRPQTVQVALADERAAALPLQSRDDRSLAPLPRVSPR